jgi:hypothetical protein
VTKQGAYAVRVDGDAERVAASGRSEDIETVRGGWCQVSRVRSIWEVGRHGDDAHETGHQSSCGRGWPGGVGGGGESPPSWRTGAGRFAVRVLRAGFAARSGVTWIDCLAGRGENLGVSGSIRVRESG